MLYRTLFFIPQVLDLFSNFTWSSNDLAIDQDEIVSHWRNPYTDFYINLCIFIVVTVLRANEGETKEGRNNHISISTL